MGHKFEQRVMVPETTSVQLETRSHGFLNAVATRVTNNWVLMLHEPGKRFDLDSWHALPGALHAAGLSTLILDLPGHGLSDGPYDQIAGLESVRTSTSWLSSMGATRIFLITAGRSAQLLKDQANERHAFAAIVLVSPFFAAPDQATMPAVPKLLLFGSLDEPAKRSAQQIFRNSRGWTLSSSFGIPEQGHALLESQWGTQATNQITSFLRDYAEYNHPSERASMPQ